MALFATGDVDADAEIGREHLFDVNLAVMQPGTLAPVDLYIKVKEPARFVLYKAASAQLTEEVRQRLLDNGVVLLYMRTSDEEAYHRYVEQNITAIIGDELLPLEEACTLVYDNSCRVMKDIFESPRSGKNLRRVHAMTEAMVLSILKNPNTLWHMTALASHDYLAHAHSVSVALFLTATARDLLGIRHLSRLKRVAYGGVLHDIGKSRVPAQILGKRGKLTDEEFEEVKQHPVTGLEMVSRCGTPSQVASSIIRSHHENVDGSGYPDGLVWKSIPPVARLARIIDAYDAMTTDRPYARAGTPYDALSTMLKLHDQFDVALLRCFVAFLGPTRSQMQPA